MAKTIKVEKSLERRITVNLTWVDSEDTSEDSNRNGRIFVSDGRIYIVPPSGEGLPGVLMPGTSIKRMYVNGEIARGPVEPKMEQKLEIVFPYTEPSSSLALSVASNGLQASIAARFNEGLIYALQDTPPSETLTLVAVISETVKPELFTKEQVLAFLKENHITFGLIEENINYFLETQSTDFIVIAKGISPVLPEDGRIDFKVGLETEMIQADESEIRVDYRNRFFIPSVKEGDILAEKINGVVGKPGKKVTGEEIPVRSPKEIEIKAGKGANLSSDGRFVFASQAGRPIYKNKVITVEPVFTVEGNVDLKQGNVNFSGDVLIKGDVLANFEVNAGRQLDIKGMVVRAKVRSRGNMSIGGNIISSKVIAASSQTPYPEIIKLYAKIISILKKISLGINQIKSVAQPSTMPSFYDGQYITQLIDMKFSELPLVIKRLSEVPIDPEDDLAPILKELTEALTSKLTGYGPRQIRDVEELNKLAERLLYVGRELEERSKFTSANLSLPYAQNSQIEATGKVFVQRGCYYSQIVSGEGIEFEKSGFFRGGTMTIFQGNLNAGTIGSPAGAETEITIVKNGVINAKEVFPNVQVSINMRRYTFSSAYKDVLMRINNDGALEFEGLKLEDSSDLR